MAYVQLAFGIVSLLLTLSGAATQALPMLKTLVNKSSNQQIQYQYRGQDQFFQYYSDETGRYWSRVDRNGVVQYAQNPNM
jgi:hypothetical protein